jgi:hypothetical protein
MDSLEDFPDFSEESNCNLESLQENSKVTMMNMIYNAIMSNEDRAIGSDTSPSEKVEALNNIIDFFVSCEEYEKCSNIKKIIDKIQC